MIHEFRVQLRTDWRGGSRGGHWSPHVEAVRTDAGPPPLDTSLIISMYEVRAHTQAEAIAVVFEWLAKDRPSAMTVREIWRRKT